MSADFEELELTSEDDIAPGSIQPVVTINQDGEHQIDLMCWGFKLPDRLLFNARAQGIDSSKFWKDAFLIDRVIVPADGIFERKEMPKEQKKPKYELTLSGQEPLGMAGIWKLWKNPKTSVGTHVCRHHRLPNELMAPIHDRVTTFLEPRDHAEYLQPAEHPPLYLLRVLDADAMRSMLIEKSPITNRQVSAFDSH